MALKLSNNAISSLLSAITADSTSIILKSGDGAKFPSLGAGDYFPATLSKSDGSLEVVRVTGRSGDTLTATRGQEGTTALSFSAGALIELRLTAATVEDINAWTQSIYVDPATGITTIDGTTIPTSKTLLVSTDIGATVQAYDADLTTLGAGGAPARAFLGLGTAATTDATAYATAAQGANANTAYGWGNHASAGYAADSAVVHKTGNETIAGTKTFSSDASISGLTVGKGGGAYTTSTAVGKSALASNTAGGNNTAIGNLALNAMVSGNNNTAVGDRCLQLGTGSDNSALGLGAMFSTTTGANNTALGSQALYSNTTASANTAVGFQAAFTNSTGAYLTAIGNTALKGNTTGTYNTAVGSGSLFTNTTGTSNSSVGNNALVYNTIGTYNTALGDSALFSNTTAGYNTVVGYQAGYNYSGTDGQNSLFGYSTGSGLTSGYSNTLLGYASGYLITTGNKNTIVGAYSGNNGGLDIRTSSGFVVLSDGDGNPVFYADPSNTCIQGSYFAAQFTLGVATNLDNIKKAGMYRVDSGAANTPTANYYALVVYGNGNNVTTQLATVIAGSNTYVRSFNSSWSAWVQIG